MLRYIDNVLHWFVQTQKTKQNQNTRQGRDCDKSGDQLTFLQKKLY